MEYFYIDESGSMTTEYANKFPFFIISVVRVFNKDLLKKRLKRFVSKHIGELKASDNGKMFNNGKFLELKGSALTIDLKKSLAEYLLDSSDLFEVHYIIVDNNKIKPATYDNTARAFNYFLEIFLSSRLNKKIFPNTDYCIQIDERNIKTNAKRTLEDYLATELQLKQELIESVEVSYYDSCNNSLIQLSDFFANLYYSYLRRKDNYDELIKKLINKGIIKNNFNFPRNKRKVKSV